MSRGADDDGAGWRTRDRRREADRAFLRRLREASPDELRLIALQLAQSRKAPLWRVVAVERALRRLDGAGGAG